MNEMTSSMHKSTTQIRTVQELMSFARAQASTNANQEDNLVRLMDSLTVEKARDLTEGKSSSKQASSSDSTYMASTTTTTTGETTTTAAMQAIFGGLTSKHFVQLKSLTPELLDLLCRLLVIFYSSVRKLQYIAELLIENWKSNSKIVRSNIEFIPLKSLKKLNGDKLTN